jgi:xylulose-5-phosphate/fructose-6-phosphate phosphoketolase
VSTAGPRPDVPSIERFWRAANYLSLSLLYLRRFVRLPEDLISHHVRSRVFGHWGVCPSVNALYAQINDFARRHGRQVQFVVGPGHAGPALLSCSFLDGSLELVHPQYTRDGEGMTRLLEAYGADGGFPTEISASYPGVQYVGGELGGALGFAQGLAIGSPHRIVVCLIGDGELETALGQSSFQGFDYLNPVSDGLVLPVINLNGYRMGARSLWAMKSRDRQVAFLASHGLSPQYAGTDHQELARCLDVAWGHVSLGRRDWPAIIFETPKGWTGPARLNGLPFADTHRAHKPLLKNPATHKDELASLRDWLASYNPADLFERDGRPTPEVLRCLPGTGLAIAPARDETKRSASALLAPSPATDSAFDALRTAVHDLAAHDDRAFLVSPDELESNQFFTQSMANPLRYGFVEDPQFSSSSRTFEILNENLCFAWAWGLAASGRLPWLISYEAFAPVFSSQADQLLKIFRAGPGNNVQVPSFSLNVILTSLGWYNTPTHHNPSFVDSLLLRNGPEVQIYMPVRPQHAAAYFRQALTSTGRLNVFVVSKHGLRALRAVIAQDTSADATTPKAGWTELVPPSDAGAECVALIAVGDLMAERALVAAPAITQHTGRQTSVLAVEDLRMFIDEHHHGWTSLHPRLSQSLQCVWLYNGRPSALKAGLATVGRMTKDLVLGYQDHDQSPSGLSRLKANGIDVIAIVDLLRAAPREEL